MSYDAPVAEIGSDDEELITDARNDYKAAMEADAKDAAEGEKDASFVAGEQWDENAVKIRNLFFRPVLTWNRLPQFAQQVINDGRKNKPSIMVTASDSGDPRTAQLKVQRIRQIEYESDADIAYDTSREQQIISGRGFYRITTEWCKDWTQSIRITPIENQFSVKYDPTANKYSREDASYLFVDTLMSKDTYRRKFGKDTPLGASNFFQTGNSLENWVNIGPSGNDVRVAEYWRKNYTPRTLVQLQNGETAWKDELAPGVNVVNEREEMDWVICQYIIDGFSVLKKTEWIGKLFPIVALWGRQEVVKGRKRNIGLFRNSHDPQKLINLYVSNIAEAIGQTPKTPYFLYEGQEEGHEKELEDLNNIPRSYQLVKPVVVAGTVLPLPQRANFEPPIQALTIGLGQAIDALKASCGIYNASLGNAPPDASGIAIQRRNNESDMGNFHFADNEDRSRKYAGRVILELMSKIEAVKDKITVRDETGKTNDVPLNTPVKHSDGTTVTHDLTQGNDEPHIFTGPSHTSARQEAAQFYATLAQQDKNFMQIGGDVLFRSMDVPGADVLADRYEKLLPQQLQNPEDPAQLKGKLSQATQMVQTLSAHVHQLQDEIDTKKPEQVTRVLIAQMQEETKRRNIQAQVTIAEANLGLKAATVQLQEQTDAIQHSIDTTQAQQQSEFEALMDHYGTMADDQEQVSEAGEAPQSDGTAPQS